MNSSPQEKNKYNKNLQLNSQGGNMLKSFVNIFTNKRLRNGIILTVVLIIVCRILAGILID